MKTMEESLDSAFEKGFYEYPKSPLLLTSTGRHKWLVNLLIKLRILEIWA